MKRCVLAAVLLAIVGSGTIARSQTNFWWTNALDDVWSSAANWTNETALSGGPVAGGSNDYTVSFANAGNTYNSTNDLGSFTLNRLLFQNVAATLWGDDLVFRLASNGTNFPQVQLSGSSNVVIQNSIIFSNTTTFTGTATGSLTLLGNITGPGGLTHSGNYILAIGGSNTYSGATTLNNGILLVQNNNALSATSGITANGGVVQLANGISVSNAAITILNANPAAGNYCGSLQVTNGSATWSGTVTLGTNGARIGAQNGTLTVSGPIDSGTNIFDLNIRAVNNTDTVILSSTNNTYKGNTAVVLGTLQLGADNTLPLTSNLQIGNSANLGMATFDMNGHNQQITGLIHLGTTMPMIVTNSSNSLLSILTLSNATAAAYNGLISGNITLIKQGAATQTLGGNNNFTGPIIIQSGTLEIGSGTTTGTLGVGDVTNNAILAFNRSDTYTVTNTLTGTGVLVQSGSGLLALAGTNTYTGNTLINNGALLVVHSNALPATSLILLNPTGALVITNTPETPFPSVTAALTSGRLATNSTGIIALANDTADDLNFTLAANSYSNLALGAIGTVTYTGTNLLFPNAIYRLGGGGGTITIASNNMLTGSSRLVAFGNGAAGTLILSATNTYTGGTFIGGGTLQTTTTGLGTGPVTNNAALVFQQTVTGFFNNPITGTGSLTVRGGGTITLTANNTFTGPTLIGSGTTLVASNTTGGASIPGDLQIGIGGGSDSWLRMGASSQFGSNTLVTYSLGSSGYGRWLLLGTTQTIVGVSDTSGRAIIENTDNAASIDTNAGPALLIISNTANYSFNGYIRDRGSAAGPSNILAIIKTGTGTLTLIGSNIGNGGISGGTTILGGTLALTNTPNFIGLTTVNGGTLLLQSANAAQRAVISNLLPNAVVFSATNEFTVGALAGGGDITLTNTSGAAIALTVGGNNASGRYTGVLRGGSSLTKTGAGVQTFVGANTYNGPTTILGGILQADYGVGIPTGSVITLNGGTWATLGSIITNSLGTGAGQINLIAGSVGGFSAYNTPLTVNLYGNGTTLVWATPDFSPSALLLNDTAANTNLVFQNGLNLNGSNLTITVNAAVAILTGTITNTGSTATFTKTGAGSLVLAGPNSSTGLILIDNNINGNTLILSNTTGNAVAGDIQLGTGAGQNIYLMLAANNQIADTAIISFNTTNNYGRFTLLGFNETIGGLSDPNAHGVVENNDNFPAFTNAGPSILTLNVGSGSNYVFAGYLRNYHASGAGPSNTLTLVKTGPGTQTLLGSNIGNGGLAGVIIQNGLLVLTNTYNFAAPTVITGGQLVLSTRTDAQNSAISNLVANGLVFGDGTNAYVLGSLAGSGDIMLTNAAGLGVALTLGGNHSNTLYSGNLADAGAGGTLIKNGLGTMILDGTNTYSGGTTVNAGALQFARSNAVPATGLVLVNSGAAAAFGFAGIQTQLARVNTTSAGLIAVTTDSAGENVNFATASLSNAYFGGVGVVLYTGTHTPFTNTYRLGAATNSTFIFTPLIGGATNLFVGGSSGTVVLTASNTYTGATTLNTGTLLLSNGNNRLPITTTVNFNGNATLALGGNSQTLSNLTVANNVTGTITGVGSTLLINGGRDLLIGGTAASTTALLDLSGLSAFVYTNPTQLVRVGGQLNGAGTSDGQLILAQTNTITAATLTLGGYPNSTGTRNNGTLSLGYVNTINASIITAGVTKTTGVLAFQNGLPANPALTLRGTDGSSRVTTFVLGFGNSSAANTIGLVDLTNNVTGVSLLDAQVTTMILGQVNNSQSASGTFIMGGGTLDVLTNIIGQTIASSGPVTGRFSLNGGTLTVQVLTMGDRPAGTGAITSQFDLNSGTVRAQTIQPGSAVSSVTRAFNWRGGTIQNYNASTDLLITNLTLTLDPVGAHVFNIESGRTGVVYANLIESAAGATLTKTGSGTLLIHGTNSYTGATTVSAGTLGGNGFITGPVTISSGATLSPGASVGTLTVGNLTLTNGVKLAFELGISSDLVIVTNLLSFSGMDTNWFVLSQAAGFGVGTYTLFDAGSLGGSTLGSDTVFDNVAGSGLSGYLWLDNVNADVKLTVVPEPGAGTLVGMGLLALLLLCRHRRESMR